MYIFHVNRMENNFYADVSRYCQWFIAFYPKKVRALQVITVEWLESSSVVWIFCISYFDSDTGQVRLWAIIDSESYVRTDFNEIYVSWYTLLCKIRVDQKKIPQNTNMRKSKSSGSCLSNIWIKKISVELGYRKYLSSRFKMSGNEEKL